MSIARRVRTGRGLLAGAIAVLIAGAIALAMSPAQAGAATVAAQLTLSGVASSSSPTGGTSVGVHPGDSVALTASAIPTAGAPGGLGDALSGLVAGVAGLQVQILSSNVPGLAGNALLNNVSGCSGSSKITTKPLAKGTYVFTYQVQTIALGGLLGLSCNSPLKVTPTQSQLSTLTANNVSVTDSAVYTGEIVSATNPPAGGIGIQLPHQSISVKAGPIHTSVTLPGATVTVPNPVGAVKSIVNKVTGAAGSKSGSGGSGSSGGSVNYTPPALTVPEKVMPNADAMGGSGKAGSSGSGSSNGLDGVAAGGGIGNAHEAAPGHGSGPSGANSSAAKKSVDLAQRFELGGKQLPALLAIAAIIALSIVTSVYTRMTLLRRR